jgi:hypothetical protein
MKVIYKAKRAKAQTLNLINKATLAYSVMKAIMMKMMIYLHIKIISINYYHKKMTFLKLKEIKIFQLIFK